MVAYRAPARVPSEREEVPVSIVGGLDIHRQQLTYDYLDVDTGQLWRGQIAPADREHLAAWLARFAPADGPVELAMEACTGWRYIAEEMAKAGVIAHLAEPAETAVLRGPKRRAKTDKADARLLRELLGPAGCRSVGSRRRTCWSAGRCWGCSTGCGPSTPPGSSGCTRCAFTRAPRRLGWARFPPPRGWPGWRSCASGSCRRRAGCRCRPPWRCWRRWTPSWTWSAASCWSAPAAWSVPGCCTSACTGSGRSPRWRCAVGWPVGAGSARPARRSAWWAWT